MVRGSSSNPPRFMTLPKGIRVDHGYIQVRITIDGRMYCKNFGKDNPAAREAAFIHLAEKRKEILMGKAGVTPKIPEISFREAANLYYEKWSTEQTPDGKSRHNENSVYQTKSRLFNTIIPHFSRFKFHEIKPKDVETWRMKRLLTVSGSTVNREQTIIASMFSHLERWIAVEKIKAFKLPEKNPCIGVEKSTIVKRERLITAYEISKLKLAATELGDENARDNISLAVKSCLSLKDLMKLKLGDTVNLSRSKTGIQVNVPIMVLHNPNWVNWRGRWETIRERAGLVDIEFRDLRKAGGNLLVGRHDIKLVSQYMGHADQKTTERFYTQVQSDRMKVLADDLSKIVDSL